MFLQALGTNGKVVKVTGGDEFPTWEFARRLERISGR